MWNTQNETDRVTWAPSTAARYMFGKGGQGTTDCIGCGLPAKLDCKDRFTGDGESSQSYPL